ncbi:hypothetical protein PAXRUDRAFT_21017 [Paxillus rubicundulus Ve08.2h10]|uniref:Uncharacterized protein n=1 Tax=Paxillus rubicundulus Ve08.2h10 TaxID=930991 RepID=A0A0D0BP27_9AGAM|nr:hypothetical protein PAXRUDRAFT_21017 [Paxillus rubicundulus Ve08.2h10]
MAINKILDEVRANYLPSAKVPSVVIAAEMQMFPIDQAITRGWPLLQAILKPGTEVNPHIWAQDAKGGEKGKKKEKKEKKEKKIERVAKGSDGGQESQGLNPGEKAEETFTDPIPIPICGPTQGLYIIEPDCHPSTPKNPIPTSLQQLLRPLHLANEGLHEKAQEGHPCQGIPPLSPGKGGLQSIPAVKQPRGQSRAPVQATEPPKALSPGPSKGPTHLSARATSKPPVTPSKRAPSLGPGPSPSKKAKASVSRSRPKTPSLT